jgi:hypothetical protein
MKKADSDDLRAEYDLSDGVRGKYSGRYSEGTNVVLVRIDPDLVTHYPTSEAVNEALRRMLETTQQGS